MNRSDGENYHGLVAEAYDLFRGDGIVEQQPWFQFYKRRLDERPGPALEPACGTGRILLPFLKAGYAMEGLDSSSEMLEICRSKTARLGVAPVLYKQYMQEMDLGNRYTTILIPMGSFILVSQRAEALEALRCFYTHLQTRGQLVFSMPTPFASECTESSAQSRSWGHPATVTRADGAKITLRCCGWSDRLEQIETSRHHYSLHQDGELLREEEHRSVTRWYGKYEMLMMLEQVGFRNMRVFGNHTDEEATAESWARVYWAEK